MNSVLRFASIGLALLWPARLSAASLADNQVKIANGMLEGVRDANSGVLAFKGIPFAQPPVGDLRWRPPQPPKNWDGVRKSEKFGPRAMQRRIFGDMGFRSDGMSEDCLYLNVWTPAKSSRDKLPVLVYFFGGGLQAGDGSEGRYDGESMAKRGIVALTINYRLNVFGFMAHPELTKESPQHASGNYGLMDQYAALQWVQANIAAFGGDPKKVTIAGESAGSISVSAMMASPLSKKLFARAIGESGSLLGALSPVPLSEAEQTGWKFATNSGAMTLADLRAMPADKLLEATGKRGAPWMSLTIDGYFFPKDPAAVFAAGEQARAPLLAGWNSEEMNYRMVLGQDDPTPANFEKAVRRLYTNQADTALGVYKPAATDDVVQVATDLASDRFISYSTWKWTDIHSQTGGKPVYRYYFSRAKPEKGNPNAGGKPRGAPHASEIEYAMGNLASDTAHSFTADDQKVSETMESYFANFIKTGNPNAKGLPEWRPVQKGRPAEFMRIDVDTQLATEQHRDRYLFLDRMAGKK